MTTLRPNVVVSNAVGQTIGLLKILKYKGYAPFSNPHGQRSVVPKMHYVFCAKCDCGATVDVTLEYIRNSKLPNCGCHKLKLLHARNAATRVNKAVGTRKLSPGRAAINRQAVWDAFNSKKYTAQQLMDKFKITAAQLRWVIGTKKYASLVE